MALETAQTLIALLVTHLIYGRFRRTRLLSDLILAYGLGLVAAANLFFVIAPVARSADAVLAYETWAPLVTRMVGAVSIASASWGLDRPCNSSSPGIRLLTGHVVTLLVISATVRALADHLPAGVEATLSSPGEGAPVIIGHPVLLGAQMVLMGLHWVAAAGFARRTSEGDALTTAFAVGFLLGGFARLNFFLHPSVYTTVVQTGTSCGSPAIWRCSSAPSARSTPIGPVWPRPPSPRSGDGRPTLWELAGAGFGDRRVAVAAAIPAAR